MKSILYVGATLMIGASIYGFVDYKKTSQQKEFSVMYDEEKKTTPITVEEANANDQAQGAIKHASGREEIGAAARETKEIKETSTETKKSRPVIKKAKKKKKLDHRIFSRAPLKEDIDGEVTLPAPPKAEEKNIEKKEQ
jgi:uncharacterized protein HemX